MKKQGNKQDDKQATADKVGAEISRIEAKYNCKLGVWLTWRDLIHNLEIMKTNKQMDIAQFGIQIQFTNGTESGN